MTDFCKKIQKLGKGISSPSRYRILELLMTGPKTVSELVVNIKLTQPAVSQHLATLRTCGLVESSKKGQEVYYTLDTRHMLTVLKSLTTDLQNCKNT
jgi:DNA-binding transcriptional ArsR family regulator